MKQYHELTIRGKARRLRGLAITALHQYDLRFTSVKLLGMHTNALFKVNTSSQGIWVLRICTPGWRTETDLRSEIAWLSYLKEYPEIGAPIPLPSTKGDEYIECQVEGVPGIRRCFVMSWIPGKLLGKNLTQRNLYKMGKLFADLHNQSREFIPPEGFTTLKMDRIFARGEPDILFNDDCRKYFSTNAYQTFKKTRDIVDKEYTRLYSDREGMRVIHHDLWHENIKVLHGHLRPMDFEDTSWGYPVQDIAMAWQDLMMDVPDDRYIPLTSSFRLGYESLCEWPEEYTGQVDTYRAGRMLWVANYVARYQLVHLVEHIKRTSILFDRFLSDGSLR